MALPLAAAESVASFAGLHPSRAQQFVPTLTEATGPQYHKRSLDVPREARNFCLRSRWKSSFVQAKRV